MRMGKAPMPAARQLATEGPMRKTFVTICLVVLTAEPAAAYRIGLFADSTAASCSLQMDAGSTGVLWVLALFGNAADEPIVGAEFGVAGIPTDLLVTMTVVQPGYILLPLVPGYTTTLAFFAPLHPSSGILPLAKILLYALSQVGETTVTIERASTNPSYQTPVLITEGPPAESCDGGSPTYQALPATGLFAVINGSCSTQTFNTSWTRIK